MYRPRFLTKRVPLKGCLSRYFIMIPFYYFDVFCLRGMKVKEYATDNFFLCRILHCTRKSTLDNIIQCTIWLQSNNDPKTKLTTANAALITAKKGTESCWPVLTHLCGVVGRICGEELHIYCLPPDCPQAPSHLTPHYPGKQTTL